MIAHHYTDMRMALPLIGLESLLRHTLLPLGMTSTANLMVNQETWDFNNDIAEFVMEISVHHARLIATMQATYAS